MSGLESTVNFIWWKPQLTSSFEKTDAPDITIIIISNSYIALLYMTSQSDLHLHVYMYYVYFAYSTQFFCFFLSLFFLTIYPIPPLSTSLSEETGEPEVNRRLSAECWPTLTTYDQCSDTGFALLTSEVGGSRSDDKAIEAPGRDHGQRWEGCISLVSLPDLDDYGPHKSWFYHSILALPQYVHTILLVLSLFWCLPVLQVCPDLFFYFGH